MQVQPRSVSSLPADDPRSRSRVMIPFPEEAAPFYQEGIRYLKVSRPTEEMKEKILSVKAYFLQNFPIYLVQADACHDCYLSEGYPPQQVVGKTMTTWLLIDVVRAKLFQAMPDVVAFLIASENEELRRHYERLVQVGLSGLASLQEMPLSKRISQAFFIVMRTSVAFSEMEERKDRMREYRNVSLSSLKPAQVRELLKYCDRFYQGVFSAKKEIYGDRVSLFLDKNTATFSGPNVVVNLATLQVLIHIVNSKLKYLYSLVICQEMEVRIIQMLLHLIFSSRKVSQHAFSESACFKLEGFAPDKVNRHVITGKDQGYLHEIMKEGLFIEHIKNFVDELRNPAVSLHIGNTKFKCGYLPRFSAQNIKLEFLKYVRDMPIVAAMEYQRIINSESIKGFEKAYGIINLPTLSRLLKHLDFNLELLFDHEENIDKLKDYTPFVDFFPESDPQESINHFFMIKLLEIVVCFNRQADELFNHFFEGLLFSNYNKFNFVHSYDFARSEYSLTFKTRFLNPNGVTLALLDSEYQLREIWGKTKREVRYVKEVSFTPFLSQKDLIEFVRKVDKTFGAPTFKEYLESLYERRTTKLVSSLKEEVVDWKQVESQLLTLFNLKSEIFPTLSFYQRVHKEALDLRGDLREKIYRQLNDNAILRDNILKLYQTIYVS